ncbi:MAG: thioredoxin family protein [Mollicutes bacterium]|nr:thioredoxin family protein [Mollicutes bacterium]
MQHYSLFLYVSSTCAKCKMIEPLLKDYLKTRPDISCFEINVDKKDGFQLALKNNVFSLPTLLILLDEKEIKRFTSNFTLEDIKEYLN